MPIHAIVAAGLVALQSAVADSAPPSPTPAPQTRYVGETLSYSLSAVMSQSIAGNDAFGKAVNQTSAPTNVKLHESIDITKATSQDLSMHRTGTITAVVVGAKPVSKSGQGWTIVTSAGQIVHDTGKLGGLFLLPLPFLADGAMKSGDDLSVGDRWSGKLGTKLYGMTAQPRLVFTVTAERLISGSKIYSIDATGSVPMKEPVMTIAGEPLGYAKGTAWISAHFEYDRDNRRLVFMRAELSDALHYSGPTKHVSGRVKDHQQCEVSLDQPSLASHDDPGMDPSAGPLP